jgi:hypothetical protein
MPMRKVDTYQGFDFYVKSIRIRYTHYTIYNILPQGSEAPNKGYFNRRYIEKLRGVKFADRYQPTKHGMSETYVSEDYAKMASC